MRTEKQVKAFRRNFTLKYLTGVIMTLNKLNMTFIINPYYKQMVEIIIENISVLVKRIKNNETYQNDFYGSSQPQKDVNYECKKCN